MMNREIIRMLTIMTLCLVFCSEVSAQFFSGKRSRDIVVKSVLNPDLLTNITVPRYGITRRDIELIEDLDGIEFVCPIRTIPVVSVQYGDRFTESNLAGTTQDFLQVENAEIETGRFLLEKDVKNLNNVIVITSSDAKRLFQNEDPLGKNLHILSEYYLIVGIIESTKKEAYIPISTMRSRIGDLKISRSVGTFRAEVFEISEVRIRLDDDSDIVSLTKAISDVLKSTHETMDYTFSSR